MKHNFKHRFLKVIPAQILKLSLGTKAYFYPFLALKFTFVHSDVHVATRILFRVCAKSG